MKWKELRRIKKNSFYWYQNVIESNGEDLVGKGFDPRKLLNPGFEAIKTCVKEKMDLFGCINKA